MPFLLRICGFGIPPCVFVHVRMTLHATNNIRVRLCFVVCFLSLLAPASTSVVKKALAMLQACSMWKWSRGLVGELGREPLERFPLPSPQRLAADLRIAATAVRDRVVRVWCVAYARTSL